MLDLHFKFLWVVGSFVGCGNAICFAIEYDVKEFIPFLMIVFDWMNPIVETIVTPCDKPTVQIKHLKKKCLVLKLQWTLVITKLFLF